MRYLKKSAFVDTDAQRHFLTEKLRMAHQFCFPDYDHSILSLSNSLLKHYGIAPAYQTLSVLDDVLAMEYKNVVLLILDGMGVELLKRSLSERAFLRRQMSQTISSVFPPTTTAATRTFYSGLPPICHGWLGWCAYFKEYDQVIELFRDTEFYTQQKLEIESVKTQLVYDSLLTQIEKATHNQVGVTDISPFTIDGVQTLSALCARVKKVTRQPGRQFVCAYWPQPDHLCHEIGPYQAPVRACLQEINKRVRQLCQSLSDTVVIISADHGHIPVDGAVYLNDYPDLLACLSKPLSLEERCTVVFVKSACHETFKQLFEAYLSKDFLLLRTAEALAQNLFGVGKPHPRAHDFLGDFLILSRSGISLRQRVNGLDPSEGLKGVHAGPTRAEIEVPLILYQTKSAQK